MPRMSAAVYAAHVDNLLKLARKKGQVSRVEVADALNVTRAVASTVIEKAGLKPVPRQKGQGRADYFKLPAAEDLEVGDTVGGVGVVVSKGEPAVKQSKSPPPVKAVAIPASDATGMESVDVDVAELDAQIVDTRNTLREAAAKAGKALGDWATHQALVDALRERLTELAARRMNASS